MFASTFGDSHFDREFGSIFDTPNFILPMKDCGEYRKEHVCKIDIRIEIALRGIQEGYQHFINNNLFRWAALVITLACVHKFMIT